MNAVKPGKSAGIWVIAIIALAFGMLTIKSGGSVLFIDGIDRANAGNYVPFVLWFNFLAGFLYLLAGIGLLMQKKWAVHLSIFIAAATLVIFGMFGLHVLNDGAYETRTVGAMSLRSVVWIAIALFAFRKTQHQ